MVDEYIVSTESGVDVYEQRSYKVVKSNEIVRHARNDLTVNQLRALSYILSKVKPGDQPGTVYSFEIKEYCLVTGIKEDNGGNYNYAKKIFKSLRDKSFWLIEPDGREVTVGYLAKVIMNRGSGRVSVKFDETFEEYIFNLQENFMQSYLQSRLPMKSRHSYNLYELMQSYAFIGIHTFEIDEFRSIMNCLQYGTFKDLRTKVIEVAVREINLYSNLEIQWEAIKIGKKVGKLKFYIKEKNAIERAIAVQRGNEELDRDQIEGQMKIEELYGNEKK